MDFLQEELDEILNIFSQEGAETLQAMDKNLLLLEKKPNNKDIAMHLFREAHSLKGSARMLGFMGIQNIAHKIEDVLGLVREDKLQITSEITDTISASLSLIDSLIKKTVELKEEFTSPETDAYIQKLEAICNKVENKEEETPKKEEPAQKEPETTEIKNDDEAEENKEIFKKNVNEFETCIVSIISDYLKYIPNNDTEKIENIKYTLKKLVKLCKKTENKTLLEKANMTLKSANSCNEGNKDTALIDLNSKINEFVLAFYNVMENLGLETKNYYEEAHKITPSQESKPQDELHKKIISDGLKNIELIELINKTNETISEINKNRHSLAEAKSLLNEIVSRLTDSTFKNIYKTILSIIVSFEKTGQKLEQDAIDALKEVFKSSVDIINQGNDITNYETFNKEIELLNQKANIVEQIIKYELQNPPRHFTRGVSKRDVWAQSFDSSPIKTLRVNSDKLDKLVNQIGNLIIARIKSHEHIGAVKGMQDELLELQKYYHKIGYYMKFYEKKYIQEHIQRKESLGGQKDSFLSYNGQLIGFHSSTSDRINSVLSHLNGLMKDLQENNIKLNAVTSDIENMVKAMRVLPLTTVFQLFPRMVHDIAKDKHKEIELTIEGQDVSADKKIIEDIKIPIMHIIRNSIDHGIESPNERERLGKNRVGNIIINAERKDHKIIISIKDDGKGINVEKIKKKAIEKGLLTHDEALSMSKEKLANYIFYPGFSTDDTVTELSGRGLGLDIVHSKISQLNGRIDVYSEENKGTVVTMELPTTMATLKTFIIMENNQLFAIPTSTIQTVLKVSPTELKIRDDKYYFIFNDEAIPIYSLASILGVKDDEALKNNKYTILVIESENVTTGLIVQKLIGDEEILHKKLPEPLLMIKNISGITTLANGEMCLLLNVSDILSSGRNDSKEISLTKSLTYQDNSNYKILVTDDSITTRRLLTNILSSAGYMVEAVANPLEALKLIENGKYNLIVSDYEMPDMNGYEFVRELRKKEQAKNTPVIIFTSIAHNGLDEKFAELNISQYIKKEDFKQQSFLNTVSKALGVY